MNIKCIKFITYHVKKSIEESHVWNEGAKKTKKDRALLHNYINSNGVIHIRYNLCIFFYTGH